MKDFGDFRNIHFLCEDPFQRLYRAVGPDGSAVLLQFEGTAGRFLSNRNDLALRMRLLTDKAWPAAPFLGLQYHHGTPFFILGDNHGSPASDWDNSHPLPIELCFATALHLTELLTHLHQKKLLAGEIPASALLLNSRSRQAAVLCLPGAMDSAEERFHPDRFLRHADHLQLQYMAPEKSGRLGLNIDHRADLYSLGVLLYRLTTGRLPFTASTPGELIHAHIAALPRYPLDLRSDLPASLAEIIFKLLAKEPVRRYHSSAGLLGELRYCRDRWLKKNTDRGNFRVGEQEARSRLQPPQNLYARTTQQQTMQQALARLREDGGKSLLLVKGHSGTGKTALVNSFLNHPATRNCLVASGKFDPHSINTPCTAIHSGFAGVVETLLAEEPERFRLWQSRLQEALGGVGQLLVEIIPELTAIIGPQEQLSSLQPDEEKSRFSWIFTRFIKALARPERPLLLFVDDMQWADSASLEMLHLILTSPGIENCMVIASWRDNEVDQTHPWTQLLHTITTRMDSDALATEELSLPPFTLMELTCFLADLLQITPEQCDSLSQLVYTKTGGNPFYSFQFLHSIHDTGLLRYTPDQGWNWDTAPIQTLTVSEDLARFLSVRIARMPASTLRLLRLASCLNGAVQLSLLASICNQQTELLPQLTPAIAAGLLFFHGSGENFELHFAHDSIRIAIYEEITPASRRRLHRCIGRRLRTRSDSTLHLYTVVGQLNLGGPTADEGEELRFARLSRQAGERAWHTSAWAAGYAFYSHGWQRYCPLDNPLLLRHRRQQTPELVYALLEGGASCAAVLSRFDELEQLFTILNELEPDLLKKVHLYELLVVARQNMGHMDEAVEIAWRYCQALGLRLPRRPGTLRMVARYFYTRWRLRNHPPEELRRLPAMTDPVQNAAWRVLSAASLAAFSSRPMFAFSISLINNLAALRYGNSYTTAYGWVTYGLSLCAISRNYRLGARYGELGMQLLEECNYDKNRARILGTLHIFVHFWTHPMEQSLQPFKKGLREGLEAGDRQFAGICSSGYSFALFFLGLPLDRVERELSEHHALAEELSQQVVRYYIHLLRRCVRGLGTPPAEEHFTDAASLTAWLEEGQINPEDDRMNLFCRPMIASALAHFFDHPELLAELADQGRRYLLDVGSMQEVSLFIYYEALGCIETLRHRPLPRLSRAALRLHHNLRLLKKWTDCCPENFSQKYYFVRAREQELYGRSDQAEQLFHFSREEAARHGFAQDEGIACEHCAELCLRQGRRGEARRLLDDALQAWQRWGAAAKVHLVQEKIHRLGLAEAPRRERPAPQPSEALSGEDLDFLAILHSSRSLAQDIGITPLLRRIVRLIVENSGATRAVLMLYSDERLLVEAEARERRDLVRIFHGLELEARPELLPLSMVNYVHHSRKEIVLNDVNEQGRFRRDPYLVRHSLASAMCVPIYHQARRMGILYLENRLTTGVFSDKRRRLLDILLSQAAVSIENARLYDELRHSTGQQLIAADQLGQKQKLLEDMSEALAEAEERERKTIAGDLHDSVSQTLALSMLKLGQAQKQVEGAGRKELQEIRGLLTTAVQEIRSLTFQLSPKVLYDFGFKAALEWLTREMAEKYSLEIALSFTGEKPEALAEARKLSLFRSIRELLINVAKHAGTREAQVRVTADSGSVMVEVEDEGQGFTDDLESRLRPDSYGLRSVEERMQRLGGELKIHSEKERGTRIVLTVPL